MQNSTTNWQKKILHLTAILCCGCGKLFEYARMLNKNKFKTKNIYPNRKPPLNLNLFARGCMRLCCVDLEDIGRNIFDNDEIIREYAPHDHRVLTTEAPVLVGLDAKEYYLYNAGNYEKSNAQHACNERQFECGNKVCIPLHLRCDGFFHCNDLTDEYGCDRYRTEQRRTTLPPSKLVRTTHSPWWNTSAATTATTTTSSPSIITTDANIVTPVVPSRFLQTVK